MKSGLVFAVLVLLSSAEVLAEKTKAEVTILSTMVAGYLSEGEWGFSALVELPQKTLLFDTGFKANTVLENSRLLNLDLSKVEEVVLTHFHSDHTGGLLTLRRAFREVNPRAFTTVYVARGFFDQRYNREGTAHYSLPNQQVTENFSTPEAFRKAAEGEGIKFTVVDSAMELAPGVILTGPIPRIHPEQNVSPNFFLSLDGELVPDTVPESQVLGIDTDEGWVLISGCGHAGIVNASEQLRKIDNQPIHMGIGGFHLFRASESTVSWTADKLGDFGYRKLVGAHCTGVHATYRIAELLQLPRENISIGAVGTRVDGDLTINRASID